VLGNYLKKILRDFVEKTFTQALFLRVIETFFALLHKGVGVIPGSYDDDALAKFEAGVDKQALAAQMQQAVLDFILPGLSVTMQAGAGVSGPVELADLDAELPKVIADVNAAIAA
jgi:hypothetical protein